MSKLVEMYSVNINKLDYFDREKEDEKAKKENRTPVYQNSSNIIYYSDRKSKEAVIKVAESELLRIIRILEGKKEGEILESIISLKVGKNRKRYKYLINSGYVRLNFDFIDGRDIKTYKSMITGAGHSRNCKSLFIRKDIANKLNRILLCGIPENTKYKRPSKWNSYYAMCSTDSVPVKTVPNFIVVDDFQKFVIEKVDEVEEYIHEGKKNIVCTMM